MKHTIRRRRALRPPLLVTRLTRRSAAPSTCTRFQIERVLELSKAQPDVAHLCYIQEQLAALEDVVITLEAY